VKNNYEIRGDVTAIFVNPNCGISEVLISTADIGKADKFPGTWRIQKTQAETFYCLGSVTKSNKASTYRLHRWITNAPIGKVVDHINHNTLDNRRENLRVVTHSENSQNRKGADTDSRCGIRGVSWHKHNNKWQAALTVNKKRISLGYFSDLEVAKAKVEKARSELMPYSKEAANN